MSGIEDRVRALMRRLTDLTDKGSIKWAAADGDAFVVTRPQGSAVIRSVDADGRRPYEFALLNDDGQEIERLAESVHESRPYDLELVALYEAARASALDITGTVNAWFEDLGPEELF